MAAVPRSLPEVWPAFRVLGWGATTMHWFTIWPVSSVHSGLLACQATAGVQKKKSHLAGAWTPLVGPQQGIALDRRGNGVRVCAV